MNFVRLMLNFPQFTIYIKQKLFCFAVVEDMSELPAHLTGNYMYSNLWSDDARIILLTLILITKRKQTATFSYARSVRTAYLWDMSDSIARTIEYALITISMSNQIRLFAFNNSNLLNINYLIRLPLNCVNF